MEVKLALGNLFVLVQTIDTICWLIQ